MSGIHLSHGLKQWRIINQSCRITSHLGGLQSMNMVLFNPTGTRSFPAHCWIHRQMCGVIYWLIDVRIGPEKLSPRIEVPNVRIHMTHLFCLDLVSHPASWPSDWPHSRLGMISWWLMIGALPGRSYWEVDGRWDWARLVWWVVDGRWSVVTWQDGVGWVRRKSWNSRRRRWMVTYLGR